MTISAPTPAPEPATIEPRRISPIDVGPWMTLPTGRLAAAMLGGVAVATAATWGAAFWLKPAGATAALLAGAAAGSALLIALLGIRPWKPRFLGQWPFAVLRASVVSMGLSLAFLVLLYSASHPDPAVFGLATVGAWFVGLLCLVAAYGSHIKGIAAGPSR